MNRIRKSCAYALMILLLTLALPFTANATTVTISTTTRQWPYGGTVATARIYADQSFFATDGEQVIGGVVGSNAWYKIVNCTIAGTTLTIPSFTLPSTTDSTDRPTARWTIVFYDQNGVKRDTWMPTFMLPPGPTPTTWSAIRNYNNAVVVRPPDNAYYTRTQADSNLAAMITGSNAAPMTDVIRGTAKTMEPASDAANPIVTGPNSIFINSSRIQTTASLPAASVREGTTTKVTDGFKGQVYDNGVSMTEANLGVYNIKDFGAKTTVGFGSGNRTAIIAARDAATAAGGGVVWIPKGTWEINGGTINAASYVTFAGESSSSGIGAATILKLASASGAIFTIGESLFNVKIKDLTLETAVAHGGVGTYGIKATGASPTATQNVQFENITTNGFDYGIAVLATDGGKAWQFSYASLVNYVAHNVVNPLYIDAINSDWNIVGWVNYGTNDGMGINCQNCGTIKIDHANFLGPAGAGAVCTAGVPNPDFSQTAIHIEGAHGAIMVVNSQVEGYRKGFVNNFPDYTYPVDWVNNVIGSPVDLNAAILFNIAGSYIYSNTITASNGALVGGNGFNNVDTRNTCLDVGTGQNGVVALDVASGWVHRASLYGTSFYRPVAVGSADPDSTNPHVATTPWFRVGRETADQKLVRLGTTNSSGVFTNYYDISRSDTTGFLSFTGNQAIPNRGISINGPLEFFGTSSDTTSPAGRARINYNATAGLTQVFENGGAAQNLLKSAAVFTAGDILKMTSNSVGAASLLRESGGNIAQASGSFALNSTTGQFVSSATTGTAPFLITSPTKSTNLNADLLDGGDWASPSAIGTGTPAAGTFTAIVGTTGTFSGAVSGTTGTFSGAVSGTTGTFSGITTPTGGIAAAGGFSFSPRLIATGGMPARTSTDGTDSTPVDTEVYIAEVFVDANATLTGVAVMNGSVASGNMKVGLANSSGVVVATSASTAMSGTDAYQRIAFTGTYAAKGPATYYVLLFVDNSTARYNTHVFGNFGCSKQTGQVYATGFTTVTPPTTFTTGLCSIASLY